MLEKVYSKIKRYRQNFRFSRIRFVRWTRFTFPFFWNWKLRLSIVLSGGTLNYLLKVSALFPGKHKQVELKNDSKHLTCIFSTANAGWCDLPCVMCKLYKPRKSESKDTWTSVSRFSNR